MNVQRSLLSKCSTFSLKPISSVPLQTRRNISTLLSNKRILSKLNSLPQQHKTLLKQVKRHFAELDDGPTVDLWLKDGRHYERDQSLEQYRGEV